MSKQVAVHELAKKITARLAGSSTRRCSNGPASCAGSPRSFNGIAWQSSSKRAACSATPSRTRSDMATGGA